jgi:hypothetical protein
MVAYVYVDGVEDRDVKDHLLNGGGLLLYGNLKQALMVDAVFSILPLLWVLTASYSLVLSIIAIWSFSCNFVFKFDK